MIESFYEFFKSGHFKQYGGGYDSVEKTDIAKILSRKRQGLDATKAIASAVGKKSAGRGGVVACGLNYETGEEDVYIVELLSRKTKASKTIEKWQKEINRDNNRPDTVVYVYDHDEMIRYLANHPLAKPEDFITDALAKLADKKNLGHIIVGKTVKEDVINTLRESVRNDDPITIREDVALENGGTAHISIISVGNISNGYVKNYRENVPGLSRILKERDISDEDIRKVIIVNHENGHANDSQWRSKAGGTLNVLKNRSDMEKMADLNAIREAFKKGDEKYISAALFWTYYRLEKAAGHVFQQAYANAALNGDIKGVLDANELKMVKEYGQLSAKFPKTQGKAEKMFDDLDDSYIRTRDKLNDLSVTGMFAAYDDAVLMYDFITEMKSDERFRKKITSMKAKEFAEFFPEYMAKHGGDKEAFGEQIIDSLEARVIPDKAGNPRLTYNHDDKNLAELFGLKEKLEKEFDVTPEEINKAMKEDIRTAEGLARGKVYAMAERKGFLEEYLHDKDGIMKEAASETDKRVKADTEFRFWDDFYRKIERESIKNGGDETAAFDKVWVAEHDRLAAGWIYGKCFLEKLDEAKIKYRDEARKRVKVFNEAAAKFKEMPMPESDIAVLKGDDLAAAYAVNRIKQLDKAEKALRAALKSRSDAAAFDDVMKTEKLAQAYAVKINRDARAREVLGDWNKKILPDEADRKSRDKGNIPGWVANLSGAVKDGGSAFDIETLRSRVSERKRLLAIEITENAVIATKIRETEPELAARLEKIAAGEKEGKAVRSELLETKANFEQIRRAKRTR